MIPQDINSKQDAWLRSRMRHSQTGYTVRKPVRPTQPKLFADITSQLNKPDSPDNPVSKTPQSYVTIPSATKPISDFKPLKSPVILNDIKKDSTYVSPRLKPTTGLTRVSHTKVLNRTAVGLRKNSPESSFNPGFHKLTPKFVITMAVVVFLVGLYVNLNGFRANHIAEVQAANLTKIANSVAKSATVKKQTSNPAVSTVKPTAADLANYVVPPSLPRYITIPSIGVDARTLSVGMTYAGNVASPNNIYDTGWDNLSSVPGQPGAMLIDGFVSSPKSEGVFQNINKLSQGDVIQIQNGSGAIFSYLVIKTQVYPAGNVNMTTASEPIIAGRPGLNLITCPGDVIPGTTQFNERIVVYAALQ